MRLEPCFKMLEKAMSILYVKQRHSYGLSAAYTDSVLPVHELKFGHCVADQIITSKRIYPFLWRMLHWNVLSLNTVFCWNWLKYSDALPPIPPHSTKHALKQTVKYCNSILLHVACFIKSAVLNCPRTVPNVCNSRVTGGCHIPFTIYPWIQCSVMGPFIHVCYCISVVCYFLAFQS